MHRGARLGSVILGVFLLALAVGLILTGDDPTPSSSPDASFESSFYERPLAADAPLDPRSDVAVAELTNLALGLPPENDGDCREAIAKPEGERTQEERSRCEQVTFSASIEHDDFAPPIWVAAEDEERVEVSIDNFEENLDQAMRIEGVPIPDDAAPAEGSDGQLVVYQPSTDTMWELWQAAEEADGSWRASWGGRIENVSASPGHFRDVADATAPGGFSERHEWGETATSLPNMPGVIRAEELRAGEIDHALNFAILNPKPDEWVYPAQRGDGICVSGSCSTIPEGARFRLDPDFDVDTLEHPVVKMIAEAAQDHGFVLNNRAGAGVTLYTEGWRPYGENVFEGETNLLQTEGGDGYTNAYMLEFPWEHLEMLRTGTVCSDSAVECQEPEWWDDQFDGE